MGATDHRFSKREYAISCMFTLLFTMLISASFFDISTCPYNSQGGAALNANRTKAPLSVFDPHFSIVPCHTLDVVVWTYVGLLIFFMAYKFHMYRSERFHYFMLDYCYFHNACLCFLIVHLLVQVEWYPALGGLLPVPVGIDILPVSTAVAGLTANRLSIATFLFFVILAGTFGPILGAILMWRNALLYHSFDKMISCYLHVAPAAVQGLVMHAALSSVRLRTTSKLRNHLKNDTNFVSLLSMHFLMFVVWQVVYHTFHETRLWMRKRAYARKVAARAAAASAGPVSPMPSAKTSFSEGENDSNSDMYHCMVVRTTAYTWMMEHPPMGKSGPLYKLVTALGTARFPSTVMFAVTQWFLHVAFFTLGFVPIYLSLNVYEAASPLLLYTCMYVLLCIYNAAAVNKSWVKKLKAKADAYDCVSAELEALKTERAAMGKKVQ